MISPGSAIPSGDVRVVVPLLASSVSYKLLPSVCLAISAFFALLASSSFCASSHSSLLSIGASTVPPETNPEDMIVVVGLPLAIPPRSSSRSHDSNDVRKLSLLKSGR